MNAALEQIALAVMAAEVAVAEEAARRRIVVNIPDRRVRLIVNDRVVKVYGAAVGAALFGVAATFLIQDVLALRRGEARKPRWREASPLAGLGCLALVRVILPRSCRALTNRKRIVASACEVAAIATRARAGLAPVHGLWAAECYLGEAGKHVLNQSVRTAAARPAS